MKQNRIFLKQKEYNFNFFPFNFVSKFLPY